jgi:hypothetical protein
MCRISATLGTNFSPVTIAPHENQNQKCILLRFDANYGGLNAKRTNAGWRRQGIGWLHVLFSNSQRWWPSGVLRQSGGLEHTGSVSLLPAELACHRVDGPRPGCEQGHRRGHHNAPHVLIGTLSQAGRCRHRALKRVYATSDLRPLCKAEDICSQRVFRLLDRLC